MIHPHTLKNGLRTLVLPLKNTEAITTLVLIGAGSRYEDQKLRGISHFLEHLFFKGGKKYRNAYEVSAAIDAVGGDFNAFTGKEYTGFYIKLAKQNLELSLDMLSDMLIHAQLAPAEIEKERNVILEEFNLYQDTPIYQIGWDFEHLLFGDQPLGWDQIGTKKNIQNFTQKDFVDYKKRFYSPQNTLIVLAGNITAAEGIKQIERHFNFPPHNETQERPAPFREPVARQVFSLKEKKTEQGHLVMGFPGVPFGDSEEFTARLLSIILGGNMSSRMFTEIREKRGLCYSIASSTDHFSDAGVISTHAGVDLARFTEAIKAIRGEYERLATGGVSEKELAHAKNFLIGKLTLRLEDSEEVAGFLGTQTILTGRAKKANTVFQEIAEVSRERLNGLAKRLFDPKKIALAVIGPFGGKEKELEKALSS